MQILGHSALYETAPAYVTDQPLFLNAALLARTHLAPLELLSVLKRVEKDAGRDLTEGVRFGPRPLDLDIIFYGSGSLNLAMAETSTLLPYGKGNAPDSSTLQIPHPRWQERSFVMAPVADLQSTSIGRLSAAASVSCRLEEASALWNRDGNQKIDASDPGDMRRVLPLPRGRSISWGSKTLLMANLNVTPGMA